MRQYGIVARSSNRKNNYGWMHTKNKNEMRRVQNRNSLHMPDNGGNDLFLYGHLKKSTEKEYEKFSFRNWYGSKQKFVSPQVQLRTPCEKMTEARRKTSVGDNTPQAARRQV